MIVPKSTRHNIAVRMLRSLVENAPLLSRMTVYRDFANDVAPSWVP